MKCGTNDFYVEACRSEFEQLKGDLPPLLRLNFRFSGGIVDVNELVARGWKLLTGVSGGAEIHLGGCSWLEYVVSNSGREYHVSLPVGNALKEVEDEDGRHSWCAIYEDALVRAYRGETPRLCFVRRISCWILDESQMSFCRNDDLVTDDLLQEAAGHLEQALRVRPKMLVEDLRAQTDEVALMGDEDEAADARTEQDFAFFKLLSILERLKKNGDQDSLARLLMPFARAVLTDGDPAGKQYLRGLTSRMCLWQLLSFVYYAEMPDAVLAVMKLCDERSDQSIWGRFSFPDYADMAVASLRRGLFWNAARAARLAADSLMRHEAGQETRLGRVFRALQDALREDARHEVEAWSISPLRIVVDALESVCSDDQDGLLLSVVRVRLDEIEGVDLKASRKGVWAMQSLMEKRFDEAHDEKMSWWLPWMPKAVKTPLAWESALCCEKGESALVLETFPRPPFSTERFFPQRPAEEPIVGLPCLDIWGWLLPKSFRTPEGYDLRKVGGFLNRWTRDYKCAGAVKVEWHEWNGEPRPLPMALSLWRSPNPEAEEMSCVVIGKDYEDSDGNLEVRMSPIPLAFPFFPKEFRGERRTIDVKLWEYHPWMYGCSAEVDFSVVGGRCFCAVMPYFPLDKWTIPVSAAVARRESNGETSSR